MRGHVDRLFAQALDEATTDRRILDKQRGPAVTFLDLHDLALEGPKREPSAHDLENVKDLLSSQQNDTSGVVASFGFAQRDVPAHYEYVARLVANGVIGCQPLPLDDRAARRNRVLLVLGREGDWSHLTLEFQQYLGGLVLRMKKLAFKSLFDASVTEVMGFVALCDGRKAQHVEPALFPQITCQVVLVHPLHH